MSDELDDIKRAFDAVTPGPDPRRKSDSIRNAEKLFAAHQGSDTATRPTSERGIFARATDGAKKMFDSMTTRGGLTATTALVAVGVLFVTPIGRELLVPPKGSDSLIEERLPTLDRREISGADDEAFVGQIAEGSSTETSDFSAEVLLEPEVVLDQANSDNAPTITRMREQAAPSSAAKMAEPAIVFEKPAAVSTEENTESFANAQTSPLKITRDDPVSTFSIDVDTASYSIVRSSINAGRLPRPEEVRVEEMINYFDYEYAEPDRDHPFQPVVSVAPTPWNDGTQLVHIGIQGEMPAVQDRPPLNLVFLIDTSGSMQDANKLPLLKQSLRLMLGELRPEDEVSIVTYAGSAGQVLEPTRAAERSVILAALDRLEAGGSTAGEAGIEQAYQVAEAMASGSEVTRVILATDGDFNVGVSDPDALTDLIERKRDSGTYLSVLGFGRGNLDDEVMQALAQNGNGTAAYIDTLAEARKVLVDQLTGALFPIANDVKIQVEFNPAAIAEYRLIGYETRGLAREDFSNDRVDAGDIGAGHSVTAIYEVTPVGSDAVRNGPLRYAETEQIDAVSDELGFLKLRYKSPGTPTSTLMEVPILPEAGDVNDDVRFSISIAGFAELLRGGEYLGSWTFEDAIELAQGSRGRDRFGYRSEALTLMRLADSLSR